MAIDCTARNLQVQHIHDTHDLYTHSLILTHDRMRLKRRVCLGVLLKDSILSLPSGKVVYISQREEKSYSHIYIQSEFIPKDSFTDSSDVDLWLKVNDTFRQKGNTKDMIFK